MGVTRPPISQEDLLETLDWVLARPERWEFMVALALCEACSTSATTCPTHLEGFRALNEGKDEVET